ncbi:MAG: 30S ribosomal protein S12 methylthiotransferase RimO [Lachnospiraceae bacterium]|nr:30S ribosomal protein S12 methylthiotransferase RimO [Lachnospiraceae bacterium]
MKIFFVSLGCDKNLVDSEKMLGLLNESGYEITDEENDADAVIVNTCCFIHDAKKESIETLLEYAELKNKGLIRYLVAAGCLAQRYKDEILKEIPETDVVLGPAACSEIVNILRSLETSRDISSVKRQYTEESGYKEIINTRLKSGLGHYSYLKIAEGCDKRCTYCIIPYIRGSYRSFPKEQLLSEAQQLVLNGVNELILVAQETSLYGTDIYGYKAIGELIDGLCAIEGLEWIRLMYCYPEEIGDQLIDAFKRQPKLCRYIDLPIQHISDNILKRMGRHTNGEQIREIIGILRKEVPGIVIRTSLITGFPGETEEEHKELLEFVRSAALERVGVFTYSREENTPAARMKDQVPASVKKRRRKELMLAQQDIVFKKNQSLTGKSFKVMIDGRLSDEDSLKGIKSRYVYIARTYMDAPDIDGSVFVESDREIMSGTMTDVTITGYNGYDLIGYETK